MAMIVLLALVVIAQGPVAWEGTTSQNRPLSFTVADGAVTSLSLDWTLPLDRICALPGEAIGIKEAGARESMRFFPNSPGNEPLKVTGGAFSVTRTLSGPPASVKGILSGRIVSPGEASGTLALSSEDCQAAVTLTWRAAPKPSDAAAAPTGPRIDSMKRTKVFQSSGGSSLRAVSDADDVVLVLKLGGVSVEEFQRVARDAVYVMAGDRKCRPGIATSGVINGEPTILLAIVVPKSILEMRLFVGTHPAVTFKASPAVSESER
jgi:hypothetical protein